MSGSEFFSRLLRWLRVRQAAGGLEISDFALRFAEWKSGRWLTAGLRLPPGVVEQGVVKNPEQFRAALQELHAMIVGPANARRRIGVVVTLSSMDIYSQTFTLPLIGGENLERAIQLNIQMASPLAAAEAYAGWQLLGESKEGVRLEVLSAFIQKTVVNQLVAELRGANFIPHSLEPRGLSLVRLIREAGEGFDAAQPHLVLVLDESGLEVLVIRRGQLYFQYFTSWSDIYGAEKQITAEAFENAIVRSLHQVINFYHAHWTEPLADIYLLTAGLAEEVAAVVKNNFSLNVLELRLGGGISATPDWFVALGAALRGTLSPAEDRELSLLGVSAREEFQRQQILNFLRFWRLLLPASLGVLLAAMVLAEMFLVRLNRQLEIHRAGLIRSDRSAEVGQLRQEVEGFNRLVALAREAMSSGQPKFEIVSRLTGLMEKRGIELIRFLEPGGGLPVTLEGRAKTEADIREFVGELGKSGEFKNINLPLAQIRQVESGVQFSLTFTLTSVKAE